MNTQTDQQLLQDYAGSRSESAFTELVRRHLDLVYSAALRMVCDSHLAQDVTQSVFITLANNAGQLTHHPVLSGWLHRTTQNLAANAVRTNVRRQTREQEAVAMNELLAHESDAAWENIAPHLDIALSELSEPDRDALLLRYFERKSAREMAQTLGTSEEAAQKRVNRAVERLREFFTKRNVTIGASGLTVVISANAVQAAPIGLFATISTVASLAGTAVQTSTAISATKIIAMTTLEKTLITIVIGVATGVGIYQARHASNLGKEIQTLRQEQAPLIEQIQKLQRERTSSAQQLAGLREENERLNRNTSELAKLRGEVGPLRNTAKDAKQIESDPIVQKARDWKAKEAKLRQLFDEKPEQRIPEMQSLTDDQWLSVAQNANFDSTRGIRLAMSRIREVALLNFAGSIKTALKRYLNANKQKLPDNPSQLSAYFSQPVEGADSLLSRYAMLEEDVKTNAAFKGMCMILEVLIDKSVDNALIVGPNSFGFAPRANQGRAGVSYPRELVTVLKAYMDANNRTTPLDLEELEPYIKTPEQRAAFVKFVQTVRQ